MSDILQGNDPYTGPSFSLSNRLKRLAWNIVRSLLFRTSPRPLHGWRRFLLTSFGAKIGKGANVLPKAVVWAPWNLEMEEFAAVADNVTVYNMARITIGRKATVSQGVHLCAGTHDYESKNFQLYAEPITVGADAWLCAECFVGPGVTIGEGAVVAARAVVVKDVPAWTVCGGNPCRPLKPRVIRDA
ncbi:MAG: putative colanic acid biosynthesis acetyltransferase [Armatimonadetes bacterium]|nr:putative colanic acid biosynthesis acetyltransferase [Armatimonadota bacterium]